MLLIILLIVALIVVICVFAKLKRLRYGNLVLISGGVKTGKTQLSVCLCFKEYKRALAKWRRACRKARRKYEPLPEKPLLYSNMPIGRPGFEYAPLTLDLLEQKKRFAYGSVVYMNEMSLIAGSKDIGDEALNDHLLKLFKLCAHETKGGYFILDTQSAFDNHYVVKRSLSTYYMIYKRLTLPFVSLLWMRENLLMDGENTVAMDNMIDTQDNVDEGGKKMYFRIIRNKWWKYYDRYAYSSLTDDLPVATETVKIGKNMKVKELVRCKDLLKRRK